MRLVFFLNSFSVVIFLLGPLLNCIKLKCKGTTDFVEVDFWFMLYLSLYFLLFDDGKKL